MALFPTNFPFLAEYSNIWAFYNGFRISLPAKSSIWHWITNHPWEITQWPIEYGSTHLPAEWVLLLNHSRKFISGSLHCTMASIQSWYQNFRQYFNLSDMEWHCNNQGCALHFPLPCGIDWKVSQINFARSHFMILLMILFEELLWWTRWRLV